MTAEQGVLATASDSVKTKERMRVCVGDELKVSWSAFERMRREGVWKVCDSMAAGEERSGPEGGGSAGVSGYGSGFSVSRRRRGSNFGRRGLRLGMGWAAFCRLELLICEAIFTALEMVFRITL